MTSGTKKYDVIVVGGGAGTKLVRPVAARGLQVAVIEKEKMGGTCLNRGCIPSKMLIQAADVAYWANKAREYHIHVAIQDIDFPKIVEEVNVTVDEEAGNIPPQYEKNPNIHLYQAAGKFVSEKVLEVGGERITADHIFLAIGARPYIPNIEGLRDTPFMTSKEALRNTKRPKKTIIIGGGYIGSELGFYYQMLGSEVHVITKGGLLTREDIDIQEEFEKGFSEIVKVHKNSQVQKVEYNQGIFTVHYFQNKEQKRLSSDALLIATGLKPWTDQIGLENTKIATDDKGFIQVNASLKTTQENVWAFGDCIGRYFYRHTANYEGEQLFKNVIVDKKERPVIYPPVPHAIFTHPRIGSVGATEQELITKNTPYAVGINSYCDSARGMALKCSEGFVKLLFHKDSRKLIGGHCIGDEASDLVHMLVAYMKMGATLEDLLDTIYVHPTLPEIIRHAAINAYEHWKIKDKQSSKVELTE
ncbi:MAG: dihydrolipoyl dehydrogenase [Chlamydiota bacterium]|jgi:dihydrolipoamide dehydrogenase